MSQKAAAANLGRAGYAHTVAANGRQAVEAGSPTPPAVSESAASLANAPVDMASLLNTCMGDLEFLAEVTRDFERQARVHLQEIEQALAASSADDVRLAAHSIKGAAGYLGAASVRAVAHRLEELARGGAIAGAAQLLGELRVELDRAVGFLRDKAAVPGGATGDRPFGEKRQP